MAISGPGLVLLASAGVLFYVALTDLKHFKIRNELVLLLAFLALVFYLLGSDWRTLIWNIGFAVLLFMPMLYFYPMRLMGGGDLKLIFVAFLWVGPFCAIEFAIFLAIFTTIHTGLAKLGWAEVQTRAGQMAIPLAPSLAAALIAVFASGCLDAASRAAVYHDAGLWISRMLFHFAPWLPHG
jgi:prepilin peptidase CpaA